MVRAIHILSVLLLLTLASAVSAQTPLTCGIVDIDGPSEIGLDEPLVFRAKIAGVSHMTKPELKWKLSAGTITAGQGTSEISVDTAGLAGVDVIATVELSGVPLGCNGLASKTTQVKPPAVLCRLPVRFDEYGDLAFDDEKARLDNFAIQLLNDSLSIGYILMSAGQKTFANETTERLDRAKNYLVKVRETDPNRVVTVDCGFTQDLTIQLYIVPLGSAPSACSTDMAVPYAEIKFTKPRAKATKKRP